MALADRRYMRDEYHPPRWTNILIVVLIVSFVVQSVLVSFWGIDARKHFALSVAGVSGGEVWQLITFQFLHACPMPWHVLFNCLGLYFFGRPVEETLGGKKLLWLYFLSGVAGGLLQVLLTILLPRHVDIAVVGASAGVCGMIAIFCSLHPMQEVTILFLPIAIRARYLLIFLGLFSLYGALVPFDGTAHGAHLGGIILGISYVRWWDAFCTWFSEWRPLRNRLRSRGLPPGESLRGRPWRRRDAPNAPQDPAVFISQEVDPILDKISARGINSLTDRERKILDAARKKMDSR